VAYLAMILFVIVILLILGVRATRSPIYMKVHPPIPNISNPVLGVLNLIGPSAETDVKADLEQVAQYFSEVRQGYDVPPNCDVILLYCNINSAGVVIGSSQALREIIRDAGAAVAVVATSNDMEDYRAGLARARGGNANLVMTIDRRGPLFASFLAQLFGQMKNGVSMPIAWGNLAPQYPGAEHHDLPETLCALEYGQIAFR
jgi:hypothetical protein